MDYDAWAEWYDLIYETAPPDETEFYVGLAQRSGGPVLEIGVGTGRIALATAAAGINVVGIDLHAPMLERARRRLAAAAALRDRIELIQADMRDFALARRFPLVTIPARTLLLATTRADQRRTLRRAAVHVADGGVLAFNAFVPTPELLAEPRDEFEVASTMDPVTGRRYRLLARNRFDTRAQRNRGQQIVEELEAAGEVGRRVTLEVVVRYLYPSEVQVLIEESGLRCLEVFGDFQRGRLTETSEEMVWICGAA